MLNISLIIILECKFLPIKKMDGFLEKESLDQGYEHFKT